MVRQRSVRPMSHQLSRFSTLETAPPAQRTLRAASVASEGSSLWLGGERQVPHFPSPGRSGLWRRLQRSLCGDGVELSPVRLTWPGHIPSLWKLFPPIDKARISRAASQEARWLTPRVPRGLCPPALGAALEAAGPGALASGVTMSTQPQPIVRTAGASPLAARILLEGNSC